MTQWKHFIPKVLYRLQTIETSMQSWKTFFFYVIIVLVICFKKEDNCWVDAIIIPDLLNVFFSSLYCSSLSFPPKLYAAMENNYAPSNVTLLISATRTGTGFQLTGTQAHTGHTDINHKKQQRQFALKLQPVKLAWIYLLLCFAYWSYFCNMVSINRCKHGWLLIWLKLVTLAPSS